MSHRFEKELYYARVAASTAAQNALRIQRLGVSAETKSDNSPVTIADKEGEKIIAGILSEAFPNDGILGEEGAAKESTSGRRWIIDPIDGTRDFVRGNHLWCVLIGLEQGDDVIAGVAHFPVLNRTYFAGRGMGAYCDDTRIQCSNKTTIEQSSVMIAMGPKILRRPDVAKWNEFVSRFWSFRCLGGALDAMMVASGQAELWIEPGAQAWDFAPLKIIGEESGAKYFTLKGTSSIYDNSGIVCAPGIEAEVRQFMTEL